MAPVIAFNFLNTERKNYYQQRSRSPSSTGKMPKLLGRMS